ncbi:MAG: acyl-CoA carboxylase subunit beta [Acidimicrobiales bacterium]
MSEQPVTPRMPPVVSLRSRTPGSVRAGVEELDGRPVVVVRSGGAGGALGAAEGANLAAAAALARRLGRPLLWAVEFSGAEVREGLDALDGWGRAARALVACSGMAPIVFAVSGPAIGGPALLLGLADHVVMSADSYAFVSGPAMVRQYTGEQVTTAALGGAGAHDRSSGAASLVAPDAAGCFAAAAHLLSYLPASCEEPAPLRPTLDPPDRPTPEAGELLPASPTGSYDVRRAVEAVVDDGDLLELRAGWAANLVTGLAAIGGQPVGVVANQPQAIAGTLDIPASQKGARFVAFCDAFNLPLVTFVDTPGFYPGKDLEWRGMIRKGAQLAFAYARATVPRVCVTLRKSYGGAYIVMDSKFMGSDLNLAWPTAEIAVMGAKQASGIIHRRADEAERARLEADYEERLLNPYVAASRGSVDQVIDPSDTRRCLAAALGALADKRERLAPRRHDNGPL